MTIRTMKNWIMAGILLAAFTLLTLSSSIQKSATWDETRVLDGSEMGTFVAFARRSGQDWYVAVLNCREKQKTYSIPLAFLGAGDYEATLYHDAPGPRTSVRIEAGHSVDKGDTISVQLKGGGGFVGRFAKPGEYTK